MNNELLSIQIDEGHLLIPLQLVADHRAHVLAKKECQKPHSRLWDRYQAEAIAYPQVAAEWVLLHMDIDEIIHQVQFITNHRQISSLFGGYHSPDQASVIRAQELQTAGYKLQLT
jgi:hypothetical protein